MPVSLSASQDWPTRQAFARRCCLIWGSTGSRGACVRPWRRRQRSDEQPLRVLCARRRPVLQGRHLLEVYSPGKPEVPRTCLGHSCSTPACVCRCTGRLPDADVDVDALPLLVARSSRVCGVPGAFRYILGTAVMLLGVVSSQWEHPGMRQGRPVHLDAVHSTSCTLVRLVGGTPPPDARMYAVEASL